MANIQAITDGQFEQEVVNADLPVLVDFWAEWCGPCKMIAPILEELSQDYGDQLKICKIDIEANNETPVKYGVRGIPTLLLFKSGEVIETQVGALSKAQLADIVSPHLS